MLIRITEFAACNLIYPKPNILIQPVKSSTLHLILFSQRVILYVAPTLPRSNLNNKLCYWSGNR